MQTRAVNLDTHAVSRSVRLYYKKPYLAERHWHKLLGVISRSVNWHKHVSHGRIEIFWCRAGNTETKKPPDEINEKTAWETHSCRMGKAWRCVTLEKASSLLLPWRRSLLGNCVAMARVSSVMRTWPHPPTPHQLWGAVRLYYWLSVSLGNRGCVFVCVCECERLRVFCLLHPDFIFSLQAPNFILHGTVLQPCLSPVSSTDPWPLSFSGGCLLSWGWNEHGMCGDGSQTDVFQPQLVSGLRPLLIGCGAGHSMAVCAATTDLRHNSAMTPLE